MENIRLNHSESSQSEEFDLERNHCNHFCLPSNSPPLQVYPLAGQLSENNAAYFSWPTPSSLNDSAEDRENYFANLQKGVLPETVGRLPTGLQAKTLLELMTIRAFHSKILSLFSLGTAIGFRIKNGVLTNIPAILVFVARKVHRNWLSHGQCLPASLEGPGNVWCDVDVVEFSYDGMPAATPKEQLYTELVDGLRGGDPCIGSGSQVANQETYGTLGAIVKSKTGIRQVGFLTNRHVAVDLDYPSQKMFHPLPPSLGPGVYLGAVERATSFITDDLWYGIFAGTNPETFVRADGAFIPFAEDFDMSKVTTSVKGIGEIGDVNKIDLQSSVHSVIGRQVKKVGRSSGLTTGTIMAYALEYNDEKGICFFTDFLVVGENQQTFDLEGDSGSLIILTSQNEEKSQPVGIIWGGTANRGRLKLRVGEPPENWTSGVDLGRLLELLELDLITSNQDLQALGSLSSRKRRFDDQSDTVAPHFSQPHLRSSKTTVTSIGKNSTAPASDGGSTAPASDGGSTVPASAAPLIHPAAPASRDFLNRRERRKEKKETVYLRTKTKYDEIPEDGFRWKHNEAEAIENSPYPRFLAQKIVERDRDDPSYSRIEYKSVHKCSSTPQFVPSEYLERCLSYCLLFPPGYEFDRDSMVQLWIAEEAIDGEATERLEDKGYVCLELLQSRGFIEVSGIKKGDDHLKYKVNEHSVSQHYTNKGSIADDFLVVGRDEFSNISRTPQHLSFPAERFNCQITEIMRMGPRLRTLLLLGDSNYLVKQVPREFFLSLNLLRTLVLSGTQVSALPTSVGNLDDLRYFDLSDTLIRELPGVLCDLVRLQALKLRNCSRFESLPKDMMKLINLRHLDLDILRLSSMPKWMGRLVNLQTFKGFVVGTDDGCGIGELYELNNITGSFCISCLENVPNAKEAEKANLRSKSYITKLVLRWEECINAEAEHEILECLLPHQNLLELQIQFFSGSTLPSWIDDPCFANLISITFYKCINCSSLSNIGNLQSLKFLNIFGMDKVMDLFCSDYQGSSCHIFFPMLEKLIIESMLHLEKWNILRADDFPYLHHLSIRNCPRLAHLPSLTSLNSLKYLELDNCPELDCLPDMPALLETLIIQYCPKLQEQCCKGEGRHWLKIAHVPSIWIQYRQISPIRGYEL